MKLKYPKGMIMRIYKAEIGFYKDGSYVPERGTRYQFKSIEEAKKWFTMITPKKSSEKFCFIWGLNIENNDVLLYGRFDPNEKEFYWSDHRFIESIKYNISKILICKEEDKVVMNFTKDDGSNEEIVLSEENFLDLSLLIENLKLNGF